MEEHELGDSANLLWQVSDESSMNPEFLQLCYTRVSPVIQNPNGTKREFSVAVPKINAFELVAPIFLDSSLEVINESQKETQERMQNRYNDENEGFSPVVIQAATVARKYLTKGTVPSNTTYQSSIAILRTLKEEQWNFLFSNDQIFHNFHLPPNIQYPHNPAFILLLKQIPSHAFQTFVEHFLLPELPKSSYTNKINNIINSTKQGSNTFKMTIK